MAKGKLATGRRGDKGRFVTLKSGRKIFIPAGKRTKWADAREKVLGRRTEEAKVAGRKEERQAVWSEWEKRGLKPEDFGVEKWADIDPEVVEDVLERAD